MSKNKNNNGTVGTEEVKGAGEAQNQGNQDGNVQNPPVPVEGDGEKKSAFQKVKDGWNEFWDEEKHPVRHKVGVVGGKVAKGVVFTAVVAGATVGCLVLAGSKNADSDSEDEDDSYDDPEDEYDDDDVVADAEAKEIDE